MKVEIKGKKITADNLKQGTCFYRANTEKIPENIMIKTKDGNCINLYDGEITFVGSNTEVIPLKAKVIVE